MNLLKHIMLWSVLATFVINPAMACCSNGSCMMSHEEASGAQKPASDEHGCDKMKANAQTTPASNITEPADKSTLMLDCSGCVDCDSFDQQAHPALLKAATLKSVDLEKIAIQPLIQQTTRFSLMLARVIPPATAPPPRVSPVSRKNRLLL